MSMSKCGALDMGRGPLWQGEKNMSLPGLTRQSIFFARLFAKIDGYAGQARVRQYRIAATSRHAPRKRGIQYVAASRFHHRRRGILDRPVKRAMTPVVVSQPRGVAR